MEGYEGVTDTGDLGHHISLTIQIHILHTWPAHACGPLLGQPQSRPPRHGIVTQKRSQETRDPTYTQATLRDPILHTAHCRHERTNLPTPILRAPTCRPDCCLYPPASQMCSQSSAGSGGGAAPARLYVAKRAALITGPLPRFAPPLKWVESNPTPARCRELHLYAPRHSLLPFRLRFGGGAAAHRYPDQHHS